MKEIWKDIKGYEGLYEISNLGNVKSLHKSLNHNYKPFILKNDDYGRYNTVRLYKDGISKVYAIHRLVAQAFIPNIENKPFINHINGNKKDNRVENIEWCTPRENNLHAFKTGLAKIYNKGMIGKDSKHSIPVEQYDLNDNFIKRWDSMSDVQRELNIKVQSIYPCCNGKKYRKSAGGYRWKYANK